jgi:hypothetical protein
MNEQMTEMNDMMTCMNKDMSEMNDMMTGMNKDMSEMNNDIKGDLFHIKQMLTKSNIIMDNITSDLVKLK